MAVYSWTPKYLNFKVSNKSHQTIDVDYWNALWNTVILQADNNTAGIEYLITNLVEVDWDEIAELLEVLEGFDLITDAEIDAIFGV